MDRGSVVVAYVGDLRRRGWHAQAAAVAREEMSSARLSSESKRALQAAYSESAVAFADAWLAFGNVRMAKRAVDAVAKAGKSIDAGEVKRLKSSLEEMGKDSKPSVLSATQPIAGVVVWPAAPGGYALNGTVQVGHNKGNHGGGKDVVGNVTAEAGLFLDGGTLSVSNGSLQFKGTAEKPVILKRVQIWCELTAVVRAEHTIFEDCTFHKTGPFFWGEYSSKWEFQDCLLRNSTFASLGRVDYGVKAARCTFVQCKLPQRNGVPGKEESIDNDAAALIRHEWSGINDCDFYYCELPTSFVWMTQGSNFFFCNISEASDFASKTDLEVTLGLPADADELLAQLAASTKSPGKGKATYTRAAEVFPREQPTSLWRWLDGAAGSKAASK